MSLLSIPLEILEDIGCHLHSKDVFSLMLTSRHFYVSLVSHLYRVARTYRLQHAKSLTDGLRDVSFWFDKEGNGTVLEWAAIHGQYNTFERLLSEPGVDLIQQDSYGVTLLHRLAGQGKVRYMQSLIKVLRKNGENPFLADVSSLTPLHFAAGRGIKEAVKLLIASGADVSAKDHHGNTPLHLAAVTGSFSVFAPLTQAGANVNRVTRFGWAAIDQASISRHSRAVEELLLLGSRPPVWHTKKFALNEYVRLSPCPMEYFYDVVFQP